MATELTKAELQEQNDLLKQELEEMKKMILGLQQSAQSNAAPVVAPQPAAPVSHNSDVAVVYMSECPGYVKGNSFELTFNHINDEFVLSRSSFDELVGKYYRWFQDGRLAVSYKNADVAFAKGLKTDKDYAVSADKLAKIATMTPDQITQLWEHCKTDNEKLCIVLYVKRMFIEGEDERFRDRARIDCLNRLSDGGFNREATELGTGSKKILPTDFLA